MTFDVDRYEDGYLLTVSPPLVEEELALPQLSAGGVERRLRDLGVHPRDITEAIWAANSRFDSGTTDRTRTIRDIWRRAEEGFATDNDVEVLLTELRENNWGGRKTYLISALYMAGQTTLAMEYLLELLNQSEEWDDVQLGLRFLSEWSPETYETVAVRFIRGVPWDNERVRAWAITYAGRLLSRGLATSLFDELVRIVTDPDEDPLAKKDARFALAQAAGMNPTTPQVEHIGFQGTDAEIALLIELVRGRLSKR